MPPENTTSPWALPYPSGVGKVNLGATDFEELAAKLNTIFNEKFLIVKTSAIEIIAKAGELVEMTAAGTVNLPKAAATNTTIGIFAQKGEVTVKTTGGEKIQGDFLAEAATSCKLATGQHVVVQYDGTRYLLMAGEPKREQVYGASTARTVGTEYEPSATRPVFVMLKIEAIHGVLHPIFVGGVEITELQAMGSEGFGPFPVSFMCPPGLKWKVGGAAAALTSSYLVL